MLVGICNRADPKFLEIDYVVGNTQAASGSPAHFPDLLCRPPICAQALGALA